MEELREGYVAAVHGFASRGGLAGPAVQPVPAAQYSSTPIHFANVSKGVLTMLRVKNEVKPKR